MNYIGRQEKFERILEKWEITVNNIDQILNNRETGYYLKFADLYNKVLCNWKAARSNRVRDYKNSMANIACNFHLLQYRINLIHMGNGSKNDPVDRNPDNMASHRIFLQENETVKVK